MTEEVRPDFGDIVRLRDAVETRALGVAGLQGRVLGWSVPSSSGVGPVVGDRGLDYAIYVDFEERDDGFWFAPHLVEFLDHGAGQEIVFPELGKRLVRREDGGWDELPME